MVTEADDIVQFDVNLCFRLLHGQPFIILPTAGLSASWFENMELGTCTEF